MDTQVEKGGYTMANDDSNSSNTGNMGGQANPNNGFQSDYSGKIDILQNSQYQSRREAVSSSKQILRAQRGDIPWDEGLKSAAKLGDQFKSINNLQRSTITNLNQQNVIMQTILQTEDEKARKQLERQLKTTQNAYQTQMQHYEDFRKANQTGFTADQKVQMDSMLAGTKKMYKESTDAFKDQFGNAYQDVFDKVNRSQSTALKKMAVNLSNTFETLFVNSKLMQLTNGVSDKAQQAVKEQQAMRNNTGWGTKGTSIVNQQVGNIMNSTGYKYSKSEIQSMMSEVQKGTNNRNAKQVSAITKSLIGENSANPQAVGSIMDMITKSQNTKGANPGKVAETWSNVERGLRRSGITGVNSSEAIQNADQSMDSILVANNNNRRRSNKAQKNMAVNSSVAMANMGGRGKSIFNELTKASSGDYNALNSLQGVGVTQNMLQAYDKTGDPSKILSSISGRLKSFGGNTAAMKSYLSGMGLNFSNDDIAGLTQFNSKKYKDQQKEAMKKVNSSIKNNSAANDITKNNDARNGNIFQKGSNWFSNSLLPNLFGEAQNKTGITTSDMFNSVNKILLYVKLIATSELISKGSNLFNSLKSLKSKSSSFYHNFKNRRGGKDGGGSDGPSSGGGGGSDLDDILDGKSPKDKKATTRAERYADKHKSGIMDDVKGAWQDTKDGKSGQMFDYDKDATRIERNKGWFRKAKDALGSGLSKGKGKLGKLFSVGSDIGEATDDVEAIMPNKGTAKTSGLFSRLFKFGSKDIAKDGTKAVAKRGLLDSIKAGGKFALKSGGKAVSKGIPFLGTAVSAGFAADDVAHGNYGTGALDAASMIPGLGIIPDIINTLGGGWVLDKLIGKKGLLLKGLRKSSSFFKRHIKSMGKWVTKSSTWKSFSKAAHKMAKGTASITHRLIKGLQKSWKSTKSWWSKLFGLNDKNSKKYKRSNNNPNNASDTNNSGAPGSGKNSSNTYQSLSKYNKKLQGVDWETQQDLGFNDIYASRSIIKDANRHSHRTGLNRVPTSKYVATTHKDEMIVPKAQSDKIRKSGLNANTVGDAVEHPNPTSSNSVNYGNQNKRNDKFNFNNPVTTHSKLLGSSLVGMMSRTLAGGSSANYLENLFKNAKFDKDAFEIPSSGTKKNSDSSTSGSVPGSEAKFARLPLSTDFGASDDEMAKFAKRTSYRVNSLYHMNKHQINNVTHYVKSHGFSPELWWAYEANEGGDDDWLNHYGGRSSSYGEGVRRTLAAFKPYKRTHIKLATSSDTSLGPNAQSKFKKLPAGSIGLLYVQETAAASAGYTGGGLGRYGDPIKQSMARIKEMGGKSSKYKQGTPWIPDDQIALLHKGEAVVPASHNPFNKTAKKTITKVNSDNSDVVSIIKWAVSQINKNMDKNSNEKPASKWSKMSTNSIKSSSEINALDYGFRF